MTSSEPLSRELIKRMNLIPEVSVVFPAYNEAANIAKVVDDFAAVLSGISAELIVVNDGSSDDTQQVLESLLLPNSSHPRITQTLPTAHTEKPGPTRFAKTAVTRTSILSVRAP